MKKALTYKALAGTLWHINIACGRNVFFVLALLGFFISSNNTASAQQLKRLQSNGLIKKGNKSYESKNYNGSEKFYDEALSYDPDSYAGNFNRGDALYKQKKYNEAAESFKKAAETGPGKNEQMSSYYNLGNCYLKTDKIEESIEAYKKALKINPDDLYSKFNLSYAIEKRKKKQQQQQQNKGNGQDKSDNNGKGKKEPKTPENGNKSEQPVLKNEGKDKISQDEAEQILDALKNDEQKIRQRMYDNQRKQNRQHTDKPW
jgi:Ca-activated chloride channel family protein